MNKAVLLTFLLVPCAATAAEQSPYSGEEQRQVKSLSTQEVESLRNGGGMGFAKLAELNHYPGPRHVLDLSDELKLSPSQLAETESLYEEMRLNAVAVGEELLAAESQLDRSFEDGSITRQSLEAALLEIGEIRARLRYIHLEAHLRQKQLLGSDQISAYDLLRGYQGTASDHNEHQGGHH